MRHVVESAAGPVSVYVADDHGELVAAATMDGAAPDTRLNAERKAYTAARSDAAATSEPSPRRWRRSSELPSFDPLFIFFKGGVAALGRRPCRGSRRRAGCPETTTRRLRRGPPQPPGSASDVRRRPKTATKRMPFRRCGRSGVQLPAISLGLWQNFGGDMPLETSRAILRRAFDLGVTHFDLANNYGPPYGSAEETFGRLLRLDLAPYRDELLVSTKAGWDMWPGPYGDGGSRKYLLASLDQSLRRMGLDYVDIFYSHRPDPDTPLEETMGALDTAVRQGKALYAGSRLRGRTTREAARDPARARHAAPDPPALVLAAQPLDRAGPARRAGRRASAASSSRRSRRAS